MNQRNFGAWRGMKIAAGAAAAALMLSGCSSAADAGGSEDDPYRILVLGALSAEGVLGINASTSVLSAEAAVDVINEEGGILGRDVEIKIVDDQADPTVAVTLVREAINSDTPPDAVLNSGPSTVAEATLPIISRAGIISFNIGPTQTSFDPGQFPYNFDIAVGPLDVAGGVSTYFEEQGFGSAAVLHGSSSYGETFGAAATESLEDAGVKILGNEEYDVASLDMTPQLEALRAKKPDALVLDAYGAPLGYILQGLEKIGWDIPIVGNTSVAATALVNTPPPSGVLGTDQVKNLVMQVFHSTVHDPAAEETNRSVEAMLSIGEIKATLILATNYDAVILLKAAVESAGGTDDVDAIAAAIEDPEVTRNVPTAMLTEYVFSDTRHAAVFPGTEFRFIPPTAIKDGQFHLED
ncbi:ABC transporter substrate-binding protein [Arthrobacter sp. 3Tela_A]|uniref:ABC transporter substrate-binding protein n=1 Tax=Arthrobacter sp. 3Tela_A TaxID=3093743 RepID=UPI003BB699EA